ncbi:hypothetical protein [Bradyrhizobium sp. BWA-3-5]|uniref:hypothetical protein n=1 Tax=Bradyrhizobium sp. BWA-3-5 TaxID=3080013 RepID=UPI00293ECF95|nr:hypothetical protein [Bradyrhizobium sp. BWA-3-5]WOH68668.1 hypothetical protein RX331_13570 [Bradyrhizobium sp. BWA-3-5]
MTKLPLEPRLDSYRGSKENLQRKAAEHNAMARRVVDHLNTLIANDPADMQQYLYHEIARDLGLTVEDVASVVMYGGHNGITVGVSEDGRRALAPYKSSAIRREDSHQ